MTCGEPVTPGWLVGMSAGAVCRVLDDPAGSAIEGIVEAAYEIAYEQGEMSAWTLRSFDPDGVTTWLSPAGDRIAEVGPGPTVRVRGI